MGTALLRMTDPNPVPRSDPTGFPCPHDRVREYGGSIDRDVRPARYVQDGVCLVCGYGVHRSTSASAIGPQDGKPLRSHREPYTPWSVFPGSSRDPLIVRPPPKL